jgi:hypothetical protein
MDPKQDPVVRKMRRSELAGDKELTLQAAEVTAVLNYFYREGPPYPDPAPHEVMPEEEEEQEVSNNGFCEDYPCCGHEWGDCFGQKYGSDESIKAAAVERMRMEDEGYFYDED